MDKLRETRRSSTTTTMSASNRTTKRKQKSSGDREEKKQRDLESLNRRRSNRFAAQRNEREDSSDESSWRRIPRHAVADEMIGVLVPRKARSACIKRSHDCRTSSGSGGGEDRRRLPASTGSYSFEVVSPSSSTVSIKHKKNLSGSKSGIPKPPKSSYAIEDDLEIEIAEVLSGLKKQSHTSKRDENHSDNSLKGIPKEKEPARIDSAVSKGVSEGPQLEYNSNSKLEIDLMVPPKMPPSPVRAVSLLPFVSDSIITDNNCKQDSVKNEMSSVEVKQQHKGEKRKWLNLDLERLSQETGRDSSPRLQNLDCSQPHQANPAQKSSALPLPVAVGGWTSGLPPGRYGPLIKNDKALDGSTGSSTLVQGDLFSASQPRPKRCATHFFIARNIQLHQHFVKTNNLSTPNQGSVSLNGGDLRPAAENSSLHGSSPVLSLNSQTKAKERIAVDPREKASESGHFASVKQKKSPLPPPPISSSIVPTQAFIFPTNHHLQPVMVHSKSPHSIKNPGHAVSSAYVNFNHSSSSASEASSPYLTVVPNNGYSFQFPSNIRGGTPPNQALPFFNGSFYSPQMFQPPHLVQRETKVVATSSSSSHKQPQMQVSMNSISSQANVQKHRQQTQNSEAKAALDNTQRGGPYGQIMTAHMQPQNFSVSFASFPGGSAPANLNFSSNGYHIVSAPPVVHQKTHQASDSKTGGGSCSTNAEDPKRTITGNPPVMTNGQTLVFDNPPRTLNFVSGTTWPPSPAATTINGDPSLFTHHLTQRQQQSGRSKIADSVPAMPLQWKNPASSSLASCSYLDLKQFQSHQQIRTQGQTQISFAAPAKSQPFQMHHGRTGGSSSTSLLVSTQHGKAANTKDNSSKALPLSPVPPSAAHAKEQTENSATGSTPKTSPVCGRNVPPIITSRPGHLSELKY